MTFLFPKKKSTRIVVALTFCVAAVIFYSVFMVYAMPGILKPYMEQKAGEALGGEAHIGAVEVYPFDFALKVRDFSVTGSMVNITWDSLYIDMQLRSVPLRSICLDEFNLNALRLRITLERNNSVSATELAAEAFLARVGVPVHIKRFVIQNGELEFLDKRGGSEKRFGIAPISFSLENFSTQYSAGEGNNYNLQFTGLNGGFFRWSGNMQWTPFVSEGEMEVRGLDVLQLRDFYQEHLPFVLKSGALDLRTHYRVAEEPEFGFTLKNAKFTLNKPSITADSSGVSMDALSLQVDSLQLSTQNRTLVASALALDSVNTHYIMRKMPDIDSKLFESVRHNINAQDSTNAGDNMFTAFLKKATNMQRWKMDVNTMQVKRAHFKLIDSIGESAIEHELNQMQLTFSHITNNPADLVSYVGSALLGNSSPLALQGTVRLFPLHAFGDLELKNFPLQYLQNYISRGTWLNMRQGTATARLTMLFRPATDSLLRDTLLFTGTAEIDSLHLLGKNNQEFLRAQRAVLNGLNFTFAPRANWQITDVNLQSPTMHLIWYAKSPANYSQITKQSSKSERIPFIINQINFTRGSLHLTDKDPTTPFSYRMAAVHGNMRNITNQKRDANLFVQGKMGGYAPFSLKGSLNLSGKYPKYNMTMEAANQDLVVFSPYSGKYAGYRIAKGQAAFNADYAVQNNKLQGNNHVVIQDLTFGEAVESQEATNLPVRLAASLLSDKNGVIDLDVSITGDLDDPEFSIGSVIWKVIKNLLGKAAAAPLKSLMALVGSNSDPETVSFAPGSAQISKAELDVLKDLSQALMHRKELQLDIYGHADSVSDGNAFRQAQIQFGVNELKNLAHTRAQNIKMELLNINASLGERVFVVDDGVLSKSAANLKIRERY